MCPRLVFGCRARVLGALVANRIGCEAVRAGIVAMVQAAKDTKVRVATSVVDWKKSLG